MTIKQNEEEAIRKAVKAIEEKIKDYEQNYAVRDKQDLLAMSALQYATKCIALEDKTVIEDENVIEKLVEINKLVSESL